MSSYSKTERAIASLLSAFPGIKPALKWGYQWLNYLFFRKKYNFRTSFSLSEYNYIQLETFFGYYDHSPENKTGEYLLYHAASLSTRKLPDPDRPLQIVLLNRKENLPTFITFSSAYNWQQGCRLQWVDKESFIFNDFDEKSKQYISLLIDINEPDKPVKIDYPVYDVFADFAISLNFDRLNLLRPDYGYRNRPWVTLKDLNDNSDGVYFVNLKENYRKLIISIDRLKNCKPDDNFNRANHKVNHIMISPGGKSFMFLHRWFSGGRRYDRLFISDMHGKELRIAAEGIVSHCCWIDDEHILGYFTKDRSLPGFHIIDLSASECKIAGINQLTAFGDGHPDIHQDLMVFDTYPDKSRIKCLLVYDMKNGKINKAGEFFESLKYSGQTRCDLHPRWSPDGKNIFFDSVHEGKRKLYSINYYE